MFPLAGAVVEGENNESWEWFLTNVRASLGGTMGSGLTIISDQHKALHILCILCVLFCYISLEIMFIFLIFFQVIIHAAIAMLPNSGHRNCARHIYANWYKLHKGEEMKLLFWNAAKAYNETNFK